MTINYEAAKVFLIQGDGIEEVRLIEISKLEFFYLNGAKNSLLKGYGQLQVGESLKHTRLLVL